MKNEIKKCTKCGEEKNIEEFGWQNKSKGQKRSWCKICMNDNQKKRYRENKEYYKECNKRWWADHPEYLKQWRGDNSRGKLYMILSGMKDRCNNSNRWCYKYYGAKGIKVCDEWLNDFVVFRDWALSNGYEEGLTIDRKDPDGNYCPENCQWITQSENSKRMLRKRWSNGNKKKAVNF